MSSLTRRNFIRISSFTPVFLSSTIQTLAQMLGVSGETIQDLIHFSGRFTRSEDLLDLEFYFINAVPKGYTKASKEKIEEEIKDGKLRSDKLVRRIKDKPAYMIVKLPPMHVAEEMLPISNTGIPAELEKFFSEKERTVRSYVSGPSFLSFQLNFGRTNDLPLSVNEFLNWNKHRMITLSDLSGNKIDGLLYDHAKGEYPIQNPTQIRLKTNENIPISYFELPYKIFLSPVVPFDFNLGFKLTSVLPVWVDQENKVKSDSFRNVVRSESACELWNNRLKIEINTPDGEYSFDPNFRIVGFANEAQLSESIVADKNPDFKRTLLPRGKLTPATAESDQREKLARLSNLNDKLGNRNTTAALFMPTGLGATAKLKYDNSNPKDYGIVGWVHEISLGRDQFVKVVTRGILYPSMTKVLIVEVGERKIRPKDKNNDSVSVSYVEYYKVIETLENVKEFGPDYVSAYFPGEQRHLNSPFKKVEVLTKKSDPFTAQQNIQNSGNQIFYPKPLGAPAQFQFRITDHNDKEIEFTCPIAVITEVGFNDLKTRNLEYFRKKIEYSWLESDTAVKDLTFINLNNQKVAYANQQVEREGSMVNNPITELETIWQQYTFDLGNDKNFDSKYPLFPQLKVAKSYLPVLKELNPNGAAAEVAYAPSYLREGFNQQVNPAQIFLNHVKKEVRDEVIYIQSQIADPFGKVNLKNMGVAINPTLPVKSVSVLDQSILLDEDANLKYSNISTIRPADIFREAKDAKILGGIQIVDILRELIPIEEAPFFQSLQGYEEKLKLFQADTLSTIEQYRNQIKAIEDQLRNIPIDPVLLAVEAFIQLELQIQNLWSEFIYIFESAKSNLTAELVSKTQTYIQLIKQIRDLLRNLNTGRLTTYTGAQYEEIRARMMISGETGYKELNQELDALLGRASQEGAEILSALLKLPQATRDKIKELLQRFETNIFINLLNEYYRRKQIFQQLYVAVRNAVKERIDDYLKLLRNKQAEIESHLQEIKSLVQLIAKDETALEILYQHLARGEDVIKEINAAKQSIAKLKADLNEKQFKLQEIETSISNAKKYFEDTVDAARRLKEEEIQALKRQIADLQAVVNGGITEVIDATRGRLLEKRKELERLLGETIADQDAIMKVKQEVDNLKAQLQWLNIPSSVSADYRWSVDKFSNQSLGLVKFIPSDSPKTIFEARANSTIQFEVPSINFSNLSVQDLRPPAIRSVSFSSENRLRNFKVRFLEIVILDFNEVTFISGTGRKTECDVKIKDVKFAGSLSFVEAIQEYLSTLGNGFRLGIESNAVRLGYTLAIPSISAGAFNFMNGSLVFDFMIPLNGDRETELRFCLSERSKKFLISVGVFGGAGYFCITLNPKDGLTEMEAALEFGAFLGINLGVARGYVYLFAGIYYKKRKTPPANEEYWGYVIAGGAMSLLGLITVSMVFYMGLENRGSYVQGRCTVSYAFKIAIKKFSVSATMYKRFSNAKSSGNRSKEIETYSIAPELETEEVVTKGRALRSSDFKTYIRSFA